MTDGYDRAVSQPGVPKEFVECIRCHGSGKHVECYDDLCHAQDHCMHGNNTCELCRGHRFISTKLAEAWRTRSLGEYVTLPDADKEFRGLEK